MYLSSQYSQSFSVSVDQSSVEEHIALISERQRSNIFALNESPTYGIYNRNDFMARCYRGCWKINARNGQFLRRLLCIGGESSKSGDCFSTFFFVIVIALPLLSIVALVPGNHFNYEERIVFITVLLAMLVALCLWHLYSIFIIMSNEKKWVKSWFTFEVSEETLGNPVHLIGSRFFDLRKHMKYYDVTKESLPSFPLLSIEHKGLLSKKFFELDIDRARLILYTDKFLRTVCLFPRYIAITLLGVSIVCVALMLIGLVYIVHRTKTT